MRDPSFSMPTGEKSRATLSRFELVALVAGLMGVFALGIDMMLPALPYIATSLSVANANDRQLVLIAYIVAAGFAQLVFGPLADAYGRRPVLLGGLVGFAVAALLCALANDFTLLLAARAIQGASAAATRVVAIALVRDLVSGVRMAQLMSTVTMIFMIVPIVAPSLGQLVLFVAPWRWIFAVLFLLALALAVWCFLRVPETLAAVNRTPPRFGAAIASYGIVMQSRIVLGYALAQMLMMGVIFSLLATSQQLFVDTFKIGAWYPLAFAAMASSMALAQFTNSRIVGRVGLKRLSHMAAVALAAIGAVHVLVALSVQESIWLFLALLLPMMFAHALTGSNYNAIAMEPMGARAGAAASFIGFMMTVGGAAIGGAIGRAFDGTQIPLLAGQTTLGLLALLVIFVTERGKMFQPPPPRAPEPPAA